MAPDDQERLETPTIVTPDSTGGQPPGVYIGRSAVAHVSSTGRLWALIVAGGSLAVLLVALWLRPDASGVGSHRQLGLSRCAFEARTNLPCLTCGMTTSFSHFARGHWVASFYVQPMGMVLALITAMTFWAATYVALTGRAAHRLLRLIPTRYYLIPLFGGLVVAWAWKIFIHVRGAGGWGA